MAQEPGYGTANVEGALNLLQHGQLIDTHGLLPWGSNYTFLMTIKSDAQEAMAVYKPQLGERPLWDFREGTLCKREVAAFLISLYLGWNIVPPTILRDGPHGMGSVQLFIPHDPDANYFTFGPEAKPQLQRIALFDSLVNNADRKGGHCLLDSRGFIWAIDHGICFHTQAKLRTVIWDFAGQAIPATLLKDVEALCDILKGGQPGIIGELSQYLSSAELQALQRRLSALIEAATYPRPDGGRSYPWPPV